MLQVDDLDLARTIAPTMRESVTSTNVFVHVEATRAAAGLGLLPCFMADRHDDLVRVLADEVGVLLGYWLVARTETLRRPEVAVLFDAIRDVVSDQRDVLLGTVVRLRVQTGYSPRMHSMKTGSGRPLLLVHGISNLHNWDLIVPALARERTVIAVDLPGFGESPALTGDVTIATLTDAVEGFIAEQGLDGVDVVGSSMGARMSLEMARRGHSGDVVALDPGGFWTDRQVKVFGATVGPSIALVKRIQPVLPALARTSVGRTALLLQFSAAPWRLPADLVLQELRNFAESPSLDQAVEALVHGPKQEGAPAGSLRSRVTIGWGRNDRVTAPSQAERAMRLFPDASLYWFERCGHFPHWDQPDETVRLILDSTG